MRNIQILLETVVRCGGNCSGCALSSSERMTKADFDFTSFKYSVSKIHSYLNERMKSDEIESLSVFLGQGDHFLLSDNDLKEIINICIDMIPNAIRNKTVILLTASAIGKNKDIKRKMDLIYEQSSSLGIPMFIQTVFDPKKIVETKNFKDTYINNILYFKEKCGMTDLTINLGNDFFEQMSAEEFHNWVIKYQFNHVEVNWVINRVTQDMWNGNITPMINWLKEWLTIYKKNPAYEINYIPIASRVLSFKDLPIMASKQAIEEILMDNLYIDSQSNLIPCKVGPINNLTPVQERLSKERVINLNNLLTGKQIIEAISQVSVDLTKSSINVLMKKKVCVSCEYKTSCAVSSGSTWLSYKGNDIGCPWGIKELYQLLEDSFSAKAFKLTAFNKNPVQNADLKQSGNETAKWFDEQVSKRIKNEE